MTTPTQGEHAQTALQPIQRFEVVDCIDSKHVPAVIPRKDGPWVRYEDHAAQVTALTAAPAQPAAPQGVAYAEPDDAFESWLEDQDVDRLSDGYESWLDSVRSCWYAALRASNGQAPAGAAKPAGRVYSANCEYAVVQWLHQTSDVGGGDPKNSWSWPTAGDAVYLVPPTPTAQAAPAAGITVEQVEDAIGLQSTAWDTIGAEKIVEAVLRLANARAPAAGAVAWPTRAEVANVFLANGFTVKEGQSDLKPYVYDAAYALLALAAAPTPAAQADSVLEDAAPSKCSINRYCHANMCLETDADHEPDCPQGHAARKQGAKYD